jgi:Raf kinase inhibitor-like YbhB/YbcL family protein
MVDPLTSLKRKKSFGFRMKSLMQWMLLLGVLPAMALARCSGDEAQKGGALMTIELTSTAFEEGGSIPAKLTCAGEDVSPYLEWHNVPEGTKSLALICDDPDAPMGTWVHWVIYGIPADTTSLAEGVPPKESIDGVALQGKNDFKRIGYGGPCPPPGKPHRYYFKLYALDTEPDLKPGATKKDLEKAMKGHILAQGQLMGTFKR